MPLIYGPRKGFNYEKSLNPRGRGKPRIERPEIVSTDTKRRQSSSEDFVNSFLSEKVCHDDFHAEVDAIKAERLARPHDPHKFWRTI